MWEALAATCTSCWPQPSHCCRRVSSACYAQMHPIFQHRGIGTGYLYAPPSAVAGCQRQQMQIPGHGDAFGFTLYLLCKLTSFHSVWDHTGVNEDAFCPTAPAPRPDSDM